MRRVGLKQLNEGKRREELMGGEGGGFRKEGVELITYLRVLPSPNFPDNLEIILPPPLNLKIVYGPEREYKSTTKVSREREEGSQS